MTQRNTMADECSNVFEQSIDLDAPEPVHAKHVEDEHASWQEMRMMWTNASSQVSVRLTGSSAYLSFWKC